MVQEKDDLIDQIRLQMSTLRKKLLTLEWDKRHNQLHAGMNEKLDFMQKEYENLQGELSELNHT